MCIDNFQIFYVNIANNGLVRRKQSINSEYNSSKIRQNHTENCEENGFTAKNQLERSNKLACWSGLYIKCISIYRSFTSAQGELFFLQHSLFLVRIVNFNGMR